jgi:hypothetical protein
MFRKTSETVQLNAFTSPGSLFSGNARKFYEDKTAWHNLFRQQVTMRINESFFSPLYCANNGTPNAPIRVLVAMMVLKEAQGISDEKLFEDCRYNMLIRSAIGLLNVDDSVPTESTFYLFRKRVNDYAKAGNENLFEVMFAELTKSQCFDFNVSGKRIRMDSKLLGSNIAWLSRYEIVHETLRLFYNQVKENNELDEATEERLKDLLKLDGNKVVYTCTNDEVKSRLQQLGGLIYKILPLFSDCQTDQYKTLQRVFNEQFKVDENQVVISREKEEISAQSVQSPHDTDSNYRNKDGNKVKGYSINVTESCDEDKGLNLIGHVDVRTVSTSDVDFLQDDILKVQDVFTQKTEFVHADGAYHSPDNQSFCKDNEIDLYLHAIQGAKGRFQFTALENEELSVLDTRTNQLIQALKLICKNGITKWRIDTGKGYRYITQKEIDTYLIRCQIAATPIETLQHRNNVEATIFQVGYHYPNAKSRYRGLIKHQMWANIRCLWVNFVRIIKYINQTCQRTTFFARYVLCFLKLGLYSAFNKFITAILPNHLSSSEIIQFSRG